MKRKHLILQSVFLMLGSIGPAVALEPDALTMQASKQFALGNISAAVELQQKEIEENPKDWLSHAGMSFYAWHEGNIIKSSEEGELAVSLAPQNYVALTNLASIKEGLDDPVTALPLYEKASKIEPNNIEAFIGIARCQNKLGKPDLCSQLLEDLGKKEKKAFVWYYEVADALLRCEKPTLASPVAEKCAALAKTTEEIEQSSVLSLLCYMQTGQISKAEALKTDVFAKYHPKDIQLYVRAAVSLISDKNPESGRELLSKAKTELRANEDAEAFYRLGKAFEQKAAQTTDAKISSEWTSVAEEAFSKACELGRSTKNYLALASTYSAEQKTSNMEQALKTVLEIDQSDLLAKYLLSRIQNNKAELENSKLEEVELTISNLNCGCHVGKVIGAMNEVEGVAFSYIPANIKPYSGIMIIDRNKIDAKSVLEKTSEKVKTIYAAMTPPIVPEFKIGKSSELKSITQAISDAQSLQYGNITEFFAAFKSVVPKEPVKELASKNENRM